MPIPTFTQGYPPDGSSLGNTKSTMRDNLDGEFLVVGVDHQTQNTIFPGAAGSHTKCSLKNTTSSTTPTLPPGIFGAGYETLYSQPAGASPLGPLGDLFYSRGGNPGIQITGPGTPTKTANGYTFLAGGILIQWGIKNAPGSGGTVTYPTPFNNAVFTLQFNYDRAVTSNAISFAINSAGPNDGTQFTYYSTTTGSNNLYWLAIGY